MMVRDMLQLLVSTHDVVRYRSVMVKIPMNTRLGSPYVQISTFINQQLS